MGRIKMIGILSAIGSIFSSGAVNSLERVASEWIETDMETAEAKTVLVKALDPNGKMRRDLSRFASRAYAFYLASAVFLIFLQMSMAMFDYGSVAEAEKAVDSITKLFLPITGSWAAIVSASFGVNATNVIKGKP